MATNPPETGAPADEATQTVLMTPTVNTPLDAPTIFVDAIQGAMLSAGVIKLSFLEQLNPYGEPLKGRYVVNLAFPSDQLRPLADAFVALADNWDKGMKDRQ